jgi:drug/metabolite transporter (DMT)-like permease
LASASPPESKDSALIRAMPAVFVLIWSTGFIVAKFGLPYAPPFTFLAVRYFLSMVCFVVWIKLAGAQWPQGRAQWLHLCVVGMLTHAGYLGGVWLAVKSGMGSGLVALVVGLQPVLTALWVSSSFGAQVLSAGSAVPVHARVLPRQWLGLALGFGGLVVVVWHKLGIGQEATALTLGAAVFALLCITAGTLYQKRFIVKTDVRSANAVQITAALLVTLPFAFLEAEPIVWNTHFVGALAWSVLVLTLGGSSLLYLLIQRGAATAVTSLMYLVPPTTAIMAWLLFNEVITAATIAGTVLTAIGVSLVVRGGAAKQPA